MAQKHLRGLLIVGFLDHDSSKYVGKKENLYTVSKKTMCQCELQPETWLRDAEGVHNCPTGCAKNGPSYRSLLLTY